MLNLIVKCSSVFMLLWMFSLSTQATAHELESVALVAGESIVLSSPREVAVTCSANPEGIVESYCHCKFFGSHHMVNLEKIYVFDYGKIQSVLLNRFGTEAECQKYKSNLNICQ
jgi:hypothetical protein